ncbi:Placenta-expressed transcript 1 protein [Myotis brandtii]|uniref:Placenta-expressed transcript 1 protein n=1 Tax=Myotis brandtii TaxID=109478 RepID=S7MDW5_MYOBR|nr:Placenta-expressed transcript 1 protein [Myotis brandtii]
MADGLRGSDKHPVGVSEIENEGNAPGPAVSRQISTMAVLGSTLLSLCFGMLLISASSADYPDRCMSFSTVFPTTGPGIKINSNIYESNRIYTISVPVDSSTNSVVLRAMDTNNNSSIGLWQRADQYCNGSVLYQRLDTREGFFKANWQSPRFTNITVEIQAFVINVNRVAMFSSLKLENQGKFLCSPFTYQAVNTVSMKVTLWGPGKVF